MIKTAVLVDGGHVISAYQQQHQKQLPTADQIMNLAKSCLVGDESLFRILYYDCRPYGGKIKFPGATQEQDFSQSAGYAQRNSLYSMLSRSDNAAFRHGELKFRGWKIDRRRIQQLTTATQTLSSKDLTPYFQQKGVDIKIGIDIASLSIKKVVDRIALLTNDTDFIPAMKFARRESTQIILCSLEKQPVASELQEHADFIRVVKF